MHIFHTFPECSLKQLKVLAGITTSTFIASNLNFDGNVSKMLGILLDSSFFILARYK